MAKRAASNASARCGDDATTITDDSPNSSVPVRCQMTIRPSAGQRFPRLVSHSLEALDGLLLIRLIGESLHTDTTLGMVADRAGEQHDGAAVGPHRPPVRVVHRKLGAGQREPVVAVEGSLHPRDRSRAHR